ncbi:MAG: hypothetical protein R3C03_06185 [Pirellulaceae bacterium]
MTKKFRSSFVGDISASMAGFECAIGLLRDEFAVAASLASRVDVFSVSFDVCEKIPLTGSMLTGGHNSPLKQ